jgi:hypothetical protein
MDEQVSPNFGSIIPNFFYDVISNIIPGGWLLIASIWTWNGQKTFISSADPKQHALIDLARFQGVAAAELFIAFLAACSLTGFLLAALSYWVIEKPWQKCRSGYMLPDLGKFIDERNLPALQKAYKREFGSELPINASLEWPSFVCSYFIWAQNVNLGIMTARFDAEKLAAQSSVLVSLTLLIEMLIRHSCLSQGSLDYLWIGLLGCCLLASAASFDYHRKKRVFGRFQMFLALASEVKRAREE